MPDTEFKSSAPVPLAPPPMLGRKAPSLGGWHSQGLCIGQDPDDFFPSYGDPGVRARRICAACAVQNDCLAYAIDADELGIWGGLDQSERRNLRRKQRRREAATYGRTPHSEDAA